ncbi:MAG: hypothetical protein GIW98_06655 [Candidatus Eremiobacteraeota bacterium]|nr:hypothetical protein [Candidatus Eremiobacteraeota bacterium]
MNRWVFGIRLKIPDNEAYTALVALQRLDVPVRKIERMDVWDFESNSSYQELAKAVENNEALFNTNKHEIVPFSQARPRTGEVWIKKMDERPDVRRLFAGKAVAGSLSAHRYTGWRLFGESGKACDAAIVQLALERLLCNPAIERAIT